MRILTQFFIFKFNLISKLILNFVAKFYRGTDARTWHVLNRPELVLPPDTSLHFFNCPINIFKNFSWVFKICERSSNHVWKWQWIILGAFNSFFLLADFRNFAGVFSILVFLLVVLIFTDFDLFFSHCGGWTVLTAIFKRISQIRSEKMQLF